MKLRSDPCRLQLVLLPFGEDKVGLDDYSIFQGESSNLMIYNSAKDLSIPIQLKKLHTLYTRS